MDNTCVCCGEIIPEGRQVCPNCANRRKPRRGLTTARLIDASALKWKLGQVTLYVPWLRFGKTAISKILESYRRAVFEEIDNAPTVDAVAVVRCKDCKHYMTIHCTCDGCCISDDWYCADGERR